MPGQHSPSLTVAVPATPWNAAPHSLLSMGFPRQENWSGLLFPSPGDIPDPEIKPMSPELADRFSTHLASWEAQVDITIHIYAGAYILKCFTKRQSKRVEDSNVMALQLYHNRQPWDSNFTFLGHKLSRILSGLTC